MKHFRLTYQAQIDLDEIWLFIAEDSKRNADRFHDLLLSKIYILATQPLIGRSRNELRPGIRSFAVRTHVIFYRNTPKYIEILRVLHGRREIQHIFLREP